MAKKATEKKVAGKRTVKKKSDTVPTRKTENKCEIKIDDGRFIEYVRRLRQPKMDYNRYYYDEVDIGKVDKWANEHPSPTPKKSPEWREIPNSKPRWPPEIKPTDEELNESPDYFAVVELARKYPDLGDFFKVLARYMENVREYSVRQRCALDRLSDGNREFKDGLIIQKSCDVMCEEFIKLRKAIKKAKE